MVVSVDNERERRPQKKMSEKPFFKCPICGRGLIIEDDYEKMQMKLKLHAREHTIKQILKYLEKVLITKAEETRKEND